MNVLPDRATRDGEITSSSAVSSAPEALAGRCKQQSSSAQLVVNMLAQGLARVLSLSSNLVLVLVVARVMSVEFFGAFSYLLAFVTIAVAVADMGTTAVLARGIALHEGEARERYVGSFLLMRLALVVLVMLAGAVVASLRTDDLRAAMLVAVTGLPALASRFFEPVYQVAQKPWLSLWTNLGFGISQLLLALWVFLHPDVSLVALTGGIVLSNVAYALLATVMMLRILRPRVVADQGAMRSLLALAAPIGVSALFTTVISRADVLMIDHYLGAAEVGIYSAAYRILDVAIFVAITLATPLIPYLTQEIAADRRRALERCRSIVLFALVGALPVAIVTPVIAPAVVEWMLGPRYAPAVAPLVVLVWNFVLIVVTLIGSSINLAIGEVAHGYWNTPLAAAINLTLNILLIPTLGIVGASVAALCGQISMMAVSHYYTFSRFGTIYTVGGLLRCAIAGAALWVMLLVLTRWMPTVYATVCSLAMYGATALALGLIPTGTLREVIEARRRRRAASA